MNYQEESVMAKDFFDNCLKILTAKANDYAKEGDCFSNFTKIGMMADVDTARTFLIFMGVKLARISELLNKEAKVNESLADSLTDISNYACLMKLFLDSQA